MIVAPERDTPGSSAQAWASPIRMASRRVIWRICRSLELTRSAMPRRTPSTIRAVPITQRLRKSRSITSLKITPSTTIGSDPMMMNQPIRESR